MYNVSPKSGVDLSFHCLALHSPRTMSGELVLFQVGLESEALGSRLSFSHKGKRDILTSMTPHFAVCTYWGRLTVQ